MQKRFTENEYESSAVNYVNGLKLRLMQVLTGHLLCVFLVIIIFTGLLDIVSGKFRFSFTFSRSVFFYLAISNLNLVTDESEILYF